MRSPRRTLSHALVLASLAASFAAAPASAAPAGWNDLATSIAAVWPGIQGADGHFPDYVTKRSPSSQRDDYGDAMLGYGLLLRAARTGDTGLRDSGLKAIRYALRSRGHTAVAPFRFMAFASAYNVARRAFPNAPLFKSSRKRWETVLKGARRLRIGRSVVTNKSIVEAVEILELNRTGLHSSKRGSILNDPRHSVALVKQLLGRELPRAARRYDRSSGRAGRTELIGDFTNVPLAYHALASGFLARAIALLGRSAPSAARRVLRRAADASWAFQAPDGDLSYIGRSQEQSWTLALSAYGAETAATQPGGSAHAGRYRGVSTRAIGRLGGDAYGVGKAGFFITPAIKSDLGAGISGLDPYVAAVSYNGMTLVGLDWAISAARGNRAPSQIGADRNGFFKLATGNATFATVRKGDLWFAVKQTHSDPTDLRYDFGLVAMQIRSSGGKWTNAMPLRPRVERAGETAGPVLRRGLAAMAEGTATKVAPGGTVTVSGGFRHGSGRWVRRGVHFRFVPTACGVQLKVPARSGDAFDYSAFFTASPTVQPKRIAGGGQELSFTPAASARKANGFASDLDPRLVRAKLRFAHVTGAGLSLTTCAR